MPINDNGSVYYEIPEEIDAKIPEYFYYALAGELCSIFGPKIFEEDDGSEYADAYGEDIDEEESISVEELIGDKCCEQGRPIYFIDYCDGTSGWWEAFIATCKKLDMMWLLDYYHTLPGWEECDIFHGILEERIVEKFILPEKGPYHNSANPYYKYLLGKESGDAYLIK